MNRQPRGGFREEEWIAKLAIRLAGTNLCAGGVPLGDSKRYNPEQTNPLGSEKQGHTKAPNLHRYESASTVTSRIYTGIIFHRKKAIVYLNIYTFTGE